MFWIFEVFFFYPNVPLVTGFLFLWSQLSLIHFHFSKYFTVISLFSLFVLQYMPFRGLYVICMRLWQGMKGDTCVQPAIFKQILSWIFSHSTFSNSKLTLSTVMTAFSFPAASKLLRFNDLKYSFPFGLNAFSHCHSLLFLLTCYSSLTAC